MYLKSGGEKPDCDMLQNSTDERWIILWQKSKV